MGLNGINVAWTTGGNNQTAPIFAAKLNWTAEETRLYNSLINLSSQVGKAMGAMYGAKLIEKGRKNTYVLSNILSIIACLIMQKVSVPTLIIGKLIHGITVTVVHMASCKMLMETVPVYYYGYFGIFI